MEGHAMDIEDVQASDIFNVPVEPLEGPAMRREEEEPVDISVPPGAPSTPTPRLRRTEVSQELIKPPSLVDGAEKGMLTNISVVWYYYYYYCHYYYY